MLIPKLTAEDKKRFYAKIAQRGPDDCWEWTAGRGNGYGAFSLGGRPYRSHRVAYFLATGEQPGDLFVIHSCDNTACCNPKHLRLGTPADNSRDMVERGRSSLGKTRPAILDDKDVIEIWRQFKHPYHGQLTDLAKKYGVTRITISSIRMGRSWAHLRPSISAQAAQSKRT